MNTIQDIRKIRGYLQKYPYDQMFSFNITHCVRLIKYVKGEFICRRNLPITGLLYLVEGRIKIYRLRQNGKMTLSCFRTSPYLIGEAELVAPSVHPSEVEAITDCYFLYIPFDPYRQQLLSDNHFLREIAAMMVMRNDRSHQTASDILAFPLKNRLAKLILSSESNGIYKEKHTEMAEYLGTSYRHFLHTLEQFCKSGYLEKQRVGYRIIDRSALESLSEELSDL